MLRPVLESETRPSDDQCPTEETLYRHRFPASILSRRNDVWRILCRRWFSRYIRPDAKVLEVGAGYCEFINNVEAAEKVAVDVNPDTARHAAPGVIVHKLSAERLGDSLPHEYFDTVFLSNLLEHCRSREEMLEVLRGSATVLKPGGRLLILGPNFRYCYKQYFDYFDHRLPLTEKAVVEALQLVGLEIESVEPRTLPFTLNSRLPSCLWLVDLYLRLRPLRIVFGRQYFVVGRRTAELD